MTSKKAKRRSAESGKGANTTNILHRPQYLRTYMVPDKERRPIKNRAEEAELRGYTSRTMTYTQRKHWDALTRSEQLEIARRANRETPTGELARKIKDIGAPYEGHCIIFDTETTPSDGQKLRFGYFQVRGIHDDQRKRLAKGDRLTRDALDVVAEHGFFYDETLPADEIEILKQSISVLERYRRCANAPEPYRWLHALTDAPPLKLLTREEFVRQIIARHAKMEDALFIGHNLAFDFGALAQEFGPAKGDYYGGFWLKYCNCDHKGDCGFHLPMRVKKIGKQQHFYGWRDSINPTTKIQGTAKDVIKGKAHFLDTATLARALIKPKSIKLGELCKLLGTVTKKGPDQDHGAPLTLDYVSYNMRDVQCTWEVYCALRAEYRKHNLSREIWWIYSSASLGAAYYEEMDVPKFLDQNKNFPPEYIGKSMSAYSGGRSEVRIRKKPCEVMLLDFKSQYPTVNALMGLQELLLAERIDIKQSPTHLTEIRAFVDSISFEDLQRAATWRLLRSYVRVVPNSDALPFRAQYDEKGDTNIGLNSVSGSKPVWYTLADIIASKLLTGKTPRIIDSFELVPHGRVATKSIKFFGDERFVIDLTRDDFFVCIIEMRTEIQELARNCNDEVERSRLDAMAEALKFIASSTSYGKLVELNIEEREEARGATVYDGDGNATRVWLNKIEKPGKYFAGPIGALIPAAGRLLLAMAEKLGAERGLSYVLCDTDSICFAKPDAMASDLFRSQVEAIADWFTVLSPYRNEVGSQVPILEIEDENYRRGEKNFGYQMLYCVAISPKRYALYNKLPYDEAVGDGYVQPIEAQGVAPGGGATSNEQPRIIIRKFSAHGTGDVSQPANYQPTLPIVLKPEKIGKSPYAAHLLHDLWRTYLEAVEAGRRPELDLSGLAMPHVRQVTVSSKYLMELYRDLPGIRPFSFFTQIPALVDKIGAEVPGDLLDTAKALNATSLYAPLGKSFDEIKDEIRRADTHERLDLDLVERCGLRFQTIADRLLDYFDRPNFKAFPPEGVGELAPRKIITTEFRHIGKETHTVKDAANLDTDYEVDKLIAKKRSARARRTDGDPLSPNTKFITRSSFSAAVLDGINLTEMSAITGIPVKTLQNYVSGRREPTVKNATKIAAALQQKAQGGFDMKAALKTDKSDNEALQQLGARQQQAALRQRLRAIIPDWLHGMPSPETCGFQYIDDVPGHVWDVTGEARKINDYNLLGKAQDRIARKHATFKKMWNDPTMVAEMSMQLTKFRRGKKLDMPAFRQLKKAVHDIEVEDQKLFDGMCTAFSGLAIEYQTLDGQTARAPHPLGEFWRRLRPPYVGD